jgi:hypothetical protein
MKTKIFIILLLTVVINSYSQSQFVIEISDEQYNIVARNGIQSDDSTYITAGFVSNYGANLDSAGVSMQKFNYKGLVLNSYQYIKKDTLSQYINIFQTDNNTYILVSVKEIKIGNFHKTIFYTITEINDDLIVLNQRKIVFPVDTLYTDWEYSKIDKDNIYIYGHCYYPNSLYGSYLCKINSDTVIFDFYNQQYFNQIALKNKYLYMSVLNWDAPINEEFQLKKINSNDFVTDTIFKGAILEYKFNDARPMLKFVDNNKLLLAWPNTDKNYQLIIFDTLLNVKNSKVIDAPYSVYDALDNWMDFKSPNHIYLCSNYSTTLTKIDSSLNLIFQKYITLPLYTVSSVIATNDSGCVVLATPSSGSRLKIIAIKFDKNGNYEPVSNLEIKVEELRIYPTPSNGILNIQKAVQIQEADFELYDIQGTLVLSQKITENITTLDLSFLPFGTYIYNAQSNNKVIGSGKWVKN